MPGHDLLDKGQPQARPFTVAQLREPAKGGVCLIQRDADAVILDHDDDHVFRALGAHCDLCHPVPTVAQGVLDKVGQRLADQHGIAVHHQGAVKAVECEIQIAGQGGRDHRLADFLDDLVQIETRHGTGVAVAQPFKLQQLVGQARRSAGGGDQFVLPGIAFCCVADVGQGFGQSQQRGGRVAQLVRGVRDEGLMRLDAVAHLAEQAVQGGHHTGDFFGPGAANAAQVIG